MRIRYGRERFGAVEVVVDEGEKTCKNRLALQHSSQCLYFIEKCEKMCEKVIVPGAWLDAMLL